MTKPTAPEILSRIQDYLSSGGLFNPEMMEHEKVRQLLLDCRNFLEDNHLKSPSFITQSTFLNRK